MLGFYTAAPVMSSDEVRTVANHGFVPVATLAETNDDDLDLAQPPAPISALNHVDRGRLLSAALRVKKVHPDPIGTLVAEHLTTWSELGWRFGGDSTIARLVEHIMSTPLPDDDLAAAA
jgi:hypothetical protein